MRVLFDQYQRIEIAQANHQLLDSSDSSAEFVKILMSWLRRMS
jgi:hypothetical protein